MASDRMYELAFRYRKTRLWKQISEDEIFAVRLSDGEIGYCCVMGQLGEHIALSLYIGAKGYDSYRRLAFPEPGAAFADPEMVLAQDCLQCSFENTDMLSEEEADEVRAYAEANGLKLRGKNAFPQFLKYRPGRCAWRYDTPSEEDRICDALAAALALADILKVYTREDIRLLPVAEEGQKIPMFAPENGRMALKSTTLPPAPEIVFPAPRLSNDVTAARLGKLKKSGTMECRILPLPTPVQENEDEAPYFPYMLLCADRDQETITNVAPVCDYEENAAELLENFAEALLRDGLCPRTILTEDARTETFLREFCARVGISLKTETALPFLEEISESMLEELAPEETDFGPELLDFDLDSPETTRMLRGLIDAFDALMEDSGGKEPLPFPTAPVDRSARKKAPRSRGNCYLCGASFTKGGFARHFTAKHGYSGRDAQECVLVRAESIWDDDYWLFLDLPVTSTLKTLDAFLRDIWLECCGHMSGFFTGAYNEVGMNRKLSSFAPGTALGYEYDFGDTTELRVTISGRCFRPKQQKAARLLARNEAYTFPCAKCGKSAEFICCECMGEDRNPFLCSSCARKHEHDAMLPVTNSPRMGVCGYCGERDHYGFDPDSIKT